MLLPLFRQRVAEEDGIARCDVRTYWSRTHIVPPAAKNTTTRKGLQPRHRPRARSLYLYNGTADRSGGQFLTANSTTLICASPGPKKTQSPLQVSKASQHKAGDAHPHWWLHMLASISLSVAACCFAVTLLATHRQMTCQRSIQSRCFTSSNSTVSEEGLRRRKRRPNEWWRRHGTDMVELQSP